MVGIRPWNANGRVKGALHGPALPRTALHKSRARAAARSKVREIVLIGFIVLLESARTVVPRLLSQCRLRMLGFPCRGLLKTRPWSD